MARDVLIIEGYLAALATRLPGPRRARVAVLDELRDGLTEAAARHTDSGSPPRAAAEAAVGEFGTVDQVAAAFAGELVTQQARHVVTVLVVTGPLVGVWWLLLLAPTSPAGIPVLPLIGVAVLIGLLVLATTGGLTRWVPSAVPRRALAGAAAVAVGCMVGDLGMLTVLATSSDAGLSVLAITAVLASLIRLGCGVHLLRACLHAQQALSGDDADSERRSAG
ncbi:permease prefix domain 1-containing protein [Lentzea sp. BCCO 10_0856]|uniref:Permease prefix domain 1-containing protein n=1 Tax=Lentzea miocenica TaxID=3095431 RepID=A0ABU4TFP2_9PSEU|nr:permease prefix domain 1-containing protein [Lentzea sp. BCCO 10_0856]MDX8036702.1 permease prefix domain 1-containing protein [Lentzea sp. BCCO 10_0856]